MPENKGITRREFLKAAGIAAAAATLPIPALKLHTKRRAKDSAAEAAFAAEGVKVARTACFICGQKCPLKVYVEGGRVRKIVYNTVKEFDSHFGICGRPQAIFEARFIPERIRKPLVRVGGKGEGRFKEISWEEALDLLAKKLKEYKPDEIIVFAHQGPDAGLFRAFMKNVVGVPNVTEHCDTCHTSFDTANKFLFGKDIGPGGFRPDYANASLVVLMGRNPVSGIVATPWTKSLSEGKGRGLRIVAFDVRESRLTELADRYYIIPPGTDLAIVLALAHVIIRDKLYNSDYLIKYTNAPMLVYTDTYEPVGLKDHPAWKGKKTYMVYDEAKGAIVWKTEAVKPALLWEGTVKGRPAKTVLSLLWDALKSYTPEWAEKITGVPAREIEWLARELARCAPRAFIDTSYKGTRYYNEGMYNRVKMIVNTLIGAIGSKGGIAWPRKPKIPSPFKVLGIKGKGPQGEPLYKFWEQQGIKNIKKKCFSMLAVRSIIEGKPHPYRMVILYNENLVSHLQGSAKAIEALKKAEFVVVIDTVFNESALYADLILPLPMFFEQDASTLFAPSKTDIVQITLVEKALDPPPGFDVRPGWWIVAELGKRIDPSNADKYEKLKNPRAIWELQAKAMGIDFSKLMKDGVLVLGTSPLYHPLKGKYLPTVTGEIELVSVSALSEFKDYIGKPSPLNPLPVWIPPKWMTRGLKDDEFVAVDVADPMTATNMWMRFSLLTSSSLEWRKLYGVVIHPERARKLGLKDGDTVEIIGPGGKLKAKVRVSPTVHPSILLGPHATNPGGKVRFRVEGGAGGYEVELFGNGGGYGLNTNFLAKFEDMVLEEGARAMQCDLIVKVKPLRG